MKRIRLAVAIVLVVAVVAAGIWWLVSPGASPATAEILTSGFIEAKDVAVALETGGRIAQIAADEGDNVAAGDVLVRLDGSLLAAQKAEAEASETVARGRLQQAIAARDAARVTLDRTLEIQLNPQELDPRYISAAAELKAAGLNLEKVQAETDSAIAAAQVKRDTAQRVLDNLNSYAVLGLVAAYQTNREIYPAEGELAAAELNLALQKDLAAIFTIPAAQLRRDTAGQALHSLLEANDFAAAQAQAAYRTAEAAVEPARQQLALAGAALEVLDLQMSKLTVASPVAGVVASRNAEAGEIVSPGAPVLNITELDTVTLTAYVPESRIGLVKLGQAAVVSVDSYPGATFTGEVTFISPQALFTPRNVQLKEEREKTVFAVKISLANPDRKLKPGMPADVRIAGPAE